MCSMSISRVNLYTLWASLWVEEFIRRGVDTFVLCPGSRCTPLTVAVAENPRARIIKHFDERGAAFAALGYGRATGNPAVWITTSGSAVANGLPAAVEACMDAVPLILLTADRPPELRGVGANQAIDQVHIFGKYVHWFVDVPCPDEKQAPEYVLDMAGEAVNRADHGPVHVNCMFREPLEPEADSSVPAAYLKSIQSWIAGTEAYSHASVDSRSAESFEQFELIELLQEASCGVIVAGQLQHAHDQDAVLKLAEKLNWPIWADVTSGLRLGAKHPLVISHYDQLLLGELPPQPDVVLHLGGRVVSKRYLSLMEKRPPKVYMVVSSNRLAYNPVHKVTHRVFERVSDFCHDMVEGMASPSDAHYGEGWRMASEGVSTCIASEVDSLKHCSEPAIARTLTRKLPDEWGLFLGNSMPIRDVDMYATGSDASLAVFANRGASGIDGNLATAVGCAFGRRGPVAVLLGDLATLHDLNSMALIANSEFPLVVTVINNDGGGIFSLLPIANHEKLFEPFFATPHGFEFKEAATMFRLPYFPATRMDEYDSVLESALASGRSAIIEVRTEREANAALHRKLTVAVKGVLSE